MSRPSRRSCCWGARWSFTRATPKFTWSTLQIYLNRLKDLEQAAAWFLSASQQEDAPFFAARIYAELLRRMNQPQAAYAYLKGLVSEPSG